MGSIIATAKEMQQEISETIEAETKEVNAEMEGVKRKLETVTEEVKEELKAYGFIF